MSVVSHKNFFLHQAVREQSSDWKSASDCWSYNFILPVRLMGAHTLLLTYFCIQLYTSRTLAPCACNSSLSIWSMCETIDTRYSKTQVSGLLTTPRIDLGAVLRTLGWKASLHLYHLNGTVTSPWNFGGQPIFCLTECYALNLIAADLFAYTFWPQSGTFETLARKYSYAWLDFWKLTVQPCVSDDRQSSKPFSIAWAAS